MTNPFIWRREAIGLGKESVAPGTPASATVRIPKKSGIMNPKIETVDDTSGLWIIDEVFDTQTIKNMTELTLGGIVRDNFIGHLFMATLWTYNAVILCTLGTPTWGTPARWQVVNVSTTWTWVIRKIILIWATTYYAVSTTTGTLADADTMTNGTWTATVGGVTANTAVKWHFFSRKNDNNNQTYTLYSDDPVGASYTPYAMIDKFSISCAVGDYVNFEASWKGKKLVSTTTQSPAYTSGNPFLAKFAHVYFADTEALLNAASAVCMQNFKLNVNKNLTDTQCFGSVDIDTINNQQFTVDWDLEALFADTTLQAYVTASTKKAARFSMINTEVTALVTGIYPAIYIDVAKAGFNDWKKSDDLNGIVKQTMGYKGIYDVANLMTMEILMLNGTVVAY